MSGNNCQFCSEGFPSEGPLQYKHLTVCPLQNHGHNSDVFREVQSEKQIAAKENQKHSALISPLKTTVTDENGPEKLPFKQDESTGKWLCGTCNKEFANKKAVRQHSLNAISCRTEVRFSCRNCGYATNRKADFERHNASAAACEIHRTAGRNTSVPEQCPKCPYFAKDKIRMAAHMASASACLLQNRKRDLRQTLGLREGEKVGTRSKKPLRCPRCGYVTTDATMMRRHMASVNACKWRNQSNQLRRQLGAEDSESLLQCPNCGYITREGSKMRSHLVSMTGCARYRRKKERE